MLALLSPAKRLDFAPTTRRLAESTPALLADAEKLVRRARRLKSTDLMNLMGISQKLADLNVERFKDFDRDGYRYVDGPSTDSCFEFHRKARV